MMGELAAIYYAINSSSSYHTGTYRVAITNASGGTTYSSNSVLNEAEAQRLPLS